MELTDDLAGLSVEREGIHGNRHCLNRFPIMNSLSLAIIVTFHILTRKCHPASP